jgi:RNA polymerase sigma factor (TIGR02999 family)
VGGPVTAILHAIQHGDPAASEKLLPAVYAELRAIAGKRMAQESPGHTLDATALVHEAYLRLIGPEVQEHNWEDRGRFFAAAAEAMRRILIDHARSKGAAKRGGDWRRLRLEEATLATYGASAEVLDLNDALERLEAEDPAKAELVKLRFFGGLTLEQAAQVMGISAATADRHWAYARAWLFADLGGSQDK